MGIRITYRACNKLLDPTPQILGPPTNLVSRRDVKICFNMYSYDSDVYSSHSLRNNVLSNREKNLV